MTYLHSLLIGLVQGLTEFFPISSSAHLKMVKLFFGIEQAVDDHLLDLSSHLGTLVATVFFLKDDIWNILKNERKKIYPIFIAMLPLVPAYFLLKPIRDAASDTKYLGFCLMGTGCILFAGSYLRMRSEKVQNKTKDYLMIGIMQSMALIPGISRSASTLSCAKVLGWSPQEAIRFSFLLSIPTILAGSAFEAIKALPQCPPSHEHPFLLYAIAFIAALAAGLSVVKIAMNMLTKEKLTPFALYCLFLGSAVWWIMGRG